MCFRFLIDFMSFGIVVVVVVVDVFVLLILALVDQCGRVFSFCVVVVVVNSLNRHAPVSRLFH